MSKGRGQEKCSEPVIGQSRPCPLVELYCLDVAGSVQHSHFGALTLDILETICVFGNVKRSAFDSRISNKARNTSAAHLYLQ